jgi:hypothetical protein
MLIADRRDTRLEVVKERKNDSSLAGVAAEG